jgi:hypothetical protein
MTARLDAISSDGPEGALSRGAPGNDPLAIFPLEPQEVGTGSGDSAALRSDAIPSQALSVPFATPSVNDGKLRTTGVVNRIKRVLRALDIAGDFENTVDSRLAALRGLDQEVQDRAWRLESLNQEITVGVVQADDLLRAVETAVAAFENRAQSASTSLGGHVAAWEARAHIAEQTITRLDDVSSRTLPALQERTKEAEEQNQSLGRLVTEAVRMAASLTALQERLPAIGQCDQDLARIELAVPQIARQMEDLNATAERQIRALAVHQQRVRQTLDESQKTAAVVSELAGRVVDLSGSHQQLDRLEKCVTQLEQRAAAAVGEVRHATRAKDELQREIAKCQQQIERLTTAAHSEAEKVNGLRRHAEYHGGDRASSPSVHELLNTLRFRRPDTSRGFSPARVTFGGAAFALSAAIILLVGIVWRMSPVENQRAEKALRAPVPASRALTLAPTLAVVLPMPPTADISRDRPVAARTAPSVPAVPVPLVVVSQTAAAARGVPTAAVREQSVTKDAKTPQFVGTLLIESDPAGAAAFVNQKSVGETPVRLKDLRAGSYVVRLEHEGYQRWSTAATVSAVRQERVKAKLERERNR